MKRWAAAGVALVATAVVLLTVAGRDGDVPRAEDGASTATAGVAPASPPPTRSAAQLVPAHLTIPSIGVSTDLVGLGLEPDRTVEVPSNGAQAGWFTRGPVPGRTGSSVVLGHVDSVDGPAVFHRLAELRAGAAIEVERSDGSVARFEVARVETYANADFPAREVYAGSPDEPALNLVTCGGVYDDERGGWQSNVVVYAVLVGTTAATA